MMHDDSALPQGYRRLHACLRAAAVAALVATVPACQILSINGREPTVSMRIKGNVRDAQVTVDDIPVGDLAYVGARGVALPKGKHRVTVEKAGYFPWDALVEATGAPVFLQVDLVPIPD